MRFLSLLLIAAVGLLSTVGAVKQPSYVAPSQAAKDILNKHKHIVVFFFENQSYDYLFATFPEGHGLDANTLKTILPQVDRDNNLYVTLPAGVMGSSGTGDLPDELPNAPYEVSKYIRMDETTDGHDGVPTHAFHNQQAQINNNRMDRFVAWSITGSYAMAYYDMTGTWLYEFARNWTLFDRWHHSAFGGSHLNHHYLVRPLPPVIASGPIDLKFLITEDARGYPTGDSIFPTKQSLTQDMYVVSTAYHCKFPYIGAPCINIEQSSRTIGHVLTDAGITWKWYAEGLDRYLANPSDPWVSANFFGHHQPFLYYKPWTDPKVATFFDAHADETKFFQQLAADTLPQVSWVKPSAEFDYHAGQNNPSQGMIKMKDYSEAILASPAWKRGEIIAIYTFDENGGHYDHVPPYKGDRFGPGCRIPTIIQSPHYKKGFVNHLPFETLSIMRMIQTRFGLPDFLAQENPTRAPTVPDLTTIFDQTDNTWDIPVAGEPKVGPVKPSCPTCPTQCGECKCNPVTCPAPPTCPTDPHQGEHGHGGAVNVNFGNMFNGFKTA